MVMWNQDKKDAKYYGGGHRCKQIKPGKLYLCIWSK